MEVLLHTELDPASITVKKRRSSGVYTIYIGSYPCLLQATGKMMYNPSVYLNGYTSICMDTEATKTVNVLSKHVAQLCQCAPSEQNSLRLYNYNKDSIGCFDCDNSSFDIHRLSRGDRVVFIFQAEGFNSKNGQLSPLLKLWQVKKLTCTSCPERPLFIEDKGITYRLSNPKCSEDKYEKMLRMGVPTAAVQQKMRMDGIVPPPPSLPPPPPPPMSMPQAPPGLAMALADIKSGNFALKKALQLQPKSSLIKRLSASAKHEPPSLEEILKAKSQLRKIM